MSVKIVDQSWSPVFQRRTRKRHPLAPRTRIRSTATSMTSVFHMMIVLACFSISLQHPVTRSLAVPTETTARGTHDTVTTKPGPDSCSEGSHDGVGEVCEQSKNETNGIRLGSMRGGDVNVDDKSERIILRFLNAFATAGGKSVDEFHVQGWRWHTMSLVRDSQRLGALADRVISVEEVGTGGAEAVEKAAAWLVQFNMEGLHRIESGLFSPWTRKHLCDEFVIGSFCEPKDTRDITEAFEMVIDRIDEHRCQVAKIGKDLHERAKAASNKSASQRQRKEFLKEVAQLASALSVRLQKMRSVQETLLVPALARTVTSSTQKSFNKKVLMNLGLLESRVHLVGMRDAVWESGNELEVAKFETEIPYVARMMIERWRKSLYAPKAGALEYGLGQ